LLCNMETEASSSHMRPEGTNSPATPVF
jgi:hypothetical protein